MHVDPKSFITGAVVTIAFIILLAPLGNFFDLPVVFVVFAIFAFLGRRGIHAQSYWLAEFVSTAVFFAIGYSLVFFAIPDMVISAIPNTIIPIFVSGIVAWYFGFRNRPNSFKPFG